MTDHMTVIQTLATCWKNGASDKVTQEWHKGIERRSHADFFWKTLLYGAMVDGDAEDQPDRAKQHQDWKLLCDFGRVCELVKQGTYVGILERFLSPQSSGGIGHRWGRNDPANPKASRIFRFLANAPNKVVRSYGSAEQAGRGLLKIANYEAAKTYLDPVLPPSWPKTRANFLMMLSLEGCQDDLAVDLRMKHICEAWCKIRNVVVPTSNHPAVVTFFREQIFPDVARLATDLNNLWQLDRLMFRAYVRDKAFADALGLVRRERKRRRRGDKLTACLR
jgi:hypothetical protein